MKTRPLLVALCSVAAVLVAAGCVTSASRPALMPPPTQSAPGESEDHQRLREEWIEMLHRHAPGLDWRRQDAGFRRVRMRQTLQAIEQLRDHGAGPGAAKRVATSAVSGSWVERGSGNVAGRTLATQYDAVGNQLSLFTHGGNVWRADRSALDWTSPADGTSFTPSRTAGFLERLTGSERLLVAADVPDGIYYSDNGGATWNAATGLTVGNAWYQAALTARDPTSSEVYALRVEYDFGPGSYRPRLYASTNRGAAFSDRGFIGQRDRVALFSPRYGSSTMYLLDDLMLKTITTGTHALVDVGSVTGAAALADGDRTALSGGVDGVGNTFLYVFILRNGAGSTEIYRSLNGGASWETRSPAPSYLFGSNSAETSTRDPSRLYVGGIDAYRSHDGAATWQQVNSWSQYYGLPAARLHADITNFDVFVDGLGIERVFVSTDGGTYESLDGLLTVQNLTLAGMRNGQYYTSYTVRAAPQAILVGAQDQGYQKAKVPLPGVTDFVQTISGDYAHLTSSNAGGRVWMVYPGFVQLDTLPATGNQPDLVSWNFSNANFQDWLFLPPIEADPLNPNRIMLAGGGIGANRHRLLTLTYNGGSITHSEGTFNFASRVTDVQFSRDGLTRYVINDAGQFYRDSGSGFSMRSSGLPDGQFFYGNCILMHATNPATIYVAGAGYSGPGVYRSLTNGDSFTAFDTGLPNTLVYDLATSADGAHLFAATELGPYYYDTGAASWVPIAAPATPDQIYWDVDFIDALQTARFSTYGRGIWDFVVDDPTQLFRNGFEG